MPKYRRTCTDREPKWTRQDWDSFRGGGRHKTNSGWRERLSTRAWWRRPTSLATSSWMSSGGARATTTPTAPASTVTWPPLETSMVAQRGDETVEMEMEEIRTVRLLDHTVDLANEEIEIEMDVDRARGEEDDARERTRASGRGKGKDGRNRDE